MLRIALLSDTHNYLDPKLFKYFEECDQIWHAGDIGTVAIAKELSSIKPLIAVYGNIDGTDVRKEYPKNQHFMCEQVPVFMTHIGGYPTRYNQEALEEIKQSRPQLFICGHSHILKVQFDKTYNLLHMNPGAAGVHGFHKVKTLLRFTIDLDKIKDLEVIELGVRA
ncbi:MAG TPA: metallophosphoesterase family protein [Bacteroidia bacterium]|nr:metallophosphoesterase family protein [Bacteroidia bacterium]HRG51564.1 metallophosphoesterase family protein [Bacteroidia bacterium]